MRSVADFGDHPALIARGAEQDRVITYSELGRNVALMARGLSELGLGKGGRCAILGQNSPEWAMAYLAISMAGGICVPLDSLLTDNELRHLLADAKVEMAFVAPRFLDTVMECPKGFPRPRWIFSLSDKTPLSSNKLLSLDKLMEKGLKHEKSLPDVHLEDTAVIIYTSGTTGRPKGVMLSQKNIVSDVAACYSVIDIGQERFLSVLPMHHTFECTAGFLLPIYLGGSVTFARSLKSNQIIEDLKASRATVMFGVPLLFQKMLDGIHRAVEKKGALQRGAFAAMMNAVKAAEKLGNHTLGYKLFKGLRQKAGIGSLRYLVVGGAPLMGSVPKGFRRLGITMLQGYGLTEASPVLAFNTAFLEGQIKDDSIGRALPGVEVKVIEPDATGVGNLAFRGPMIMHGYLNDKATTELAIDKDGWLLTGDLGYIDSDGFIFISGRAKNVIVTSSGKNVYPEEIESLLNMSPFVLESMVFGKKEEDGGEAVSAVIVPDYETIGQRLSGKKMGDKDVFELLAEEVKKLNNALASYKRIKSFNMIDEELPKTSTRKIKRHLFRVQDIKSRQMAEIRKK